MQHSGPGFDELALRRLIDRVQALVLGFDTLDVEQCITATVDAFKAVPAGLTGRDRLLLVSLILDVAVSLVRSAHNRAYTAERCSCRTTLAMLADALVDRTSDDLSATLTRWLSEFERVYRQWHRESRALQAATLIRANPTYHWTLELLANRFGCRPRTLTEEFRSVFGATLHQYLGASRLLAVFDLLNTDEKISAIADDAGYRSPKDFYRVVADCTGLTPRALRLLALPDRLDIREMLEAALTRRRSAPQGSGRSRVPRAAAMSLRAVRRRAIAAATQCLPVRITPAKAALPRRRHNLKAI